MMTERSWERFCKTAHKVMHDALENRITLTRASDYALDWTSYQRR